MFKYYKDSEILDFSFVTFLLVTILTIIFLHFHKKSYGLNQFNKPYSVRFPKVYKNLLVITLIAWLFTITYYISSLENLS